MNSFFKSLNRQLKLKIPLLSKNDTVPIYSTTYDVIANFNKYLQKHTFYRQPRHNILLSAINRRKRDLHFNFRVFSFDLKLKQFIIAIGRLPHVFHFAFAVERSTTNFYNVMSVIQVKQP